MPHIPDTAHDTHDLELVAAHAAGDAEGPALEQAAAARRRLHRVRCPPPRPALDRRRDAGAAGARPAARLPAHARAGGLAPTRRAPRPARRVLGSPVRASPRRSAPGSPPWASSASSSPRAASPRSGRRAHHRQRRATRPSRSSPLPTVRPWATPQRAPRPRAPPRTARPRHPPPAPRPRRRRPPASTRSAARLRRLPQRRRHRRNRSRRRRPRRQTPTSTSPTSRPRRRHRPRRASWPPSPSRSRRSSRRHRRRQRPPTRRRRSSRQALPRSRFSWRASRSSRFAGSPVAPERRDTRQSRSGSRTVKIDPRPGIPSLVTSTVPPWAAARSRTIARPRPVPPESARRWKRSKTRASSSGAMPSPSSTTVSDRVRLGRPDVDRHLTARRRVPQRRCATRLRQDLAHADGVHARHERGVAGRRELDPASPRRAGALAATTSSASAGEVDRLAVEWQRARPRRGTACAGRRGGGP